LIHHQAVICHSTGLQRTTYTPQSALLPRTTAGSAMRRPRSKSGIFDLHLTSCWQQGLIKSLYQHFTSTILISAGLIPRPLGRSCHSRERDCVTIRHSGQDPRREARAGIQKSLSLFPIPAFRTSLRFAPFVRNDVLDEWRHSLESGNLDFG
jgi:hypothetical protein